MAWQYENGPGTDRATNNRDLLTKMVAFLTSQHVATVLPNAAGSGYVQGDIVTLTHAGAYLDAKFEVTAVNGSGGITALRIVANGAFSNRINGTSAIPAAGSGYAVGDILEVQGGTSREKGKFQVATLSGSGVASVTVFETGGAYSSAPGAGSTTTKVGPAAGSGSGCTVTPTMTGLIGTTGLAVTGGTGTSATVDITLAQTGWTVDGRNTNSTTINGVPDEKQVVLKGDASGWTNKPYIGFGTVNATFGVSTRYGIAFYGLITHNPAAALSAQPLIKGTPGSTTTGAPYLLCDENQIQAMDFWFSASDRAFSGVLDTNSSAANSDSSEYHHFYAGYIDSFATEVEDPYPMMCAASAGSLNQNPSAESATISGLSEMYYTTGVEGAWVYVNEESLWRPVRNGPTAGTSGSPALDMFPLCEGDRNNNGGADQLVGLAASPTVIDAWETFMRVTGNARDPALYRLLNIPGTTPYHYPVPLTLIYKITNVVSESYDTVRGTLSGWYWVFNTNSSGATTTNFSEDYITVGSDRYRVFHTHVNKELYHYVCVKESV